MTTIKIVGEDWCPYTQGSTEEKGAWLQMPTGEQGEQGDNNKTKIKYEKLDCAERSDISAGDRIKFCGAAEGFPSFMDSAGNTCTRGFDRDTGFGDGTTDGVTKTIQDKMGDGMTCA